MKKTILFYTILLFISSCNSDDSDSVSLSNQNTIISFSISDQEGVIRSGEGIISVIVPENTSLTSLSPTITISDGATISPASGVPQDFTNPVDYIVTAEDGDTLTFTVTVSTNIFSFNFDDRLYELVKEEMTWEEAAAFATNRGGFLAEINSGAEQSVIFFELTNNANIILQTLSLTEVWLGGNDRANDGVWIFDGDNDGVGEQFWEGGVDGSAVNNSFTNWGLEPDGRTTQNELTMVLVDAPRNDAGQWNDRNNDQTLFFVIEYN